MMRVAAASVIVLVSALASSDPAAGQVERPAIGTLGSTASDYTFNADTALLLFYVHQDRTADFETVIARVAQALDASPDPVRRQQAAAWRMLRGTEPVRDAVVYVFLLDPVVAGADYDPVRVLSEGLPAEVQPLYETLKAAVIRVERMPLARVR